MNKDNAMHAGPYRSSVARFIAVGLLSLGAVLSPAASATAGCLVPESGAASDSSTTTIARRFAASQTADAIRIAPRQPAAGHSEDIDETQEASRDYTVLRTCTGNQLELTLQQQGHLANPLSFQYDEQVDDMKIAVGETVLNVGFDHFSAALEIDGELCAIQDLVCIVSKVKAFLHSVGVRDIAAIELGVEAQLKTMEHGGDVSRLLNLFVEELYPEIVDL